MLFFCDRLIPGTHDVVSAETPEFHAIRRKFWGLHGALEIVGGTGGRDLSVSMYLHNRYWTLHAMHAAITDLSSLQGQHGLLREWDAYNQCDRTWQGCTLDSIEWLAFPGREDTGPVRDYAGGIDGGWVQAVSLHFHQLKA